MHFFTSAEKGERYNSSYVFHFTEVYTNKYFGTFSILCSVINLMAQFWWRWAYILETYYSPRERFTFFLSFHSMSLGIQGWVGDWVSVVSKCIMGLFRRTLSPLSLAITKLHGKMGMNASPAIVPQCRKFRPHWDPPPPPPKSKMQKWRVLSIGRLYPWFRGNVSFHVSGCSILLCPRLWSVSNVNSNWPMTVITQCTYVALLGYLQKTFHDESLQGLLHYGYQVLYREVYHAALEPPEAIPLTQTI